MLAKLTFSLLIPSPFWLFLILCCPAAGQLSPARKPDQFDKTDKDGPLARLIRSAHQVLFTQPDSAFLRASQALQLAEQQNSLLGMADSHEIIGTVFYYQGVYKESLDHLLRAEDM